jgi:hypothetical protein
MSRLRSCLPRALLVTLSIACLLAVVLGVTGAQPASASTAISDVNGFSCTWKWKGTGSAWYLRCTYGSSVSSLFPANGSYGSTNISLYSGNSTTAGPVVQTVTASAMVVTRPFAGAVQMELASGWSTWPGARAYFIGLSFGTGTCSYSMYHPVTHVGSFMCPYVVGNGAGVGTGYDTANNSLEWPDVYFTGGTPFVPDGCAGMTIAAPSLVTVYVDGVATQDLAPVIDSSVSFVLTWAGSSAPTVEFYQSLWHDPSSATTTASTSPKTFTARWRFPDHSVTPAGKVWDLLSNSYFRCRNVSTDAWSYFRFGSGAFSYGLAGPVFRACDAQWSTSTTNVGLSVRGPTRGTIVTAGASLTYTFAAGGTVPSSFQYSFVQETTGASTAWANTFPGTIPTIGIFTLVAAYDGPLDVRFKCVDAVGTDIKFGPTNSVDVAAGPAADGAGCLDKADFGLSPASWVPGLVRMGSCVVVLLFVPTAAPIAEVQSAWTNGGATWAQPLSSGSAFFSSMRTAASSNTATCTGPTTGLPGVNGSGGTLSVNLLSACTGTASQARDWVFNASTVGILIVGLLMALSAARQVIA